MSEKTVTCTKCGAENVEAPYIDAPNPNFKRTVSDTLCVCGWTMSQIRIMWPAAIDYITFSIDLVPPKDV